MKPLLLIFLTVMIATHLSAADGSAAPPRDLVRFAAPWTSPYRVDPKWPYHLVNGEDQHLFIMCRTGWAYFGCKDPEGFLNRSKTLGCNVIRVALEGQPYFKELGIELWPWGGTREKPDFSSFNEAYWDQVEHRIRLAGEKGIGIDLVLYMTLKPKADDVASHRLYWQQAIKRLGKYANILTWEIHNEYTSNESFQDAAGEYFAQNDPFGHPVCTSAGTTSDAIWPEKKWMHLAINHSCTGSGQAGGADDKRKHTLDGWYLAVARNTRAHGKPAFCNESGREKRHKNDDGVHRRKQGWIWTTAGAYWTWHSWDGCEGIEDGSYQAPGAQFVPMYAKFWTSLPFWTLSPDETSIGLDEKTVIWTALSDEKKNLLVAYLCVEETGGAVQPMPIRLMLPVGEYVVRVIQPSDLHAIMEKDVVVGKVGQATEIRVPGWTDDAMLRIERKPGK